MVELTDKSYEEQVNSEKLTMIDFYADWCAPCRVLGPIVEDLNLEYEGDNDVFISKINVDNNPEVSSKYGIRSIPTILFFKNGEIVDRSTGVTPKDKLKEIIEKLK